MEKRKIQLAVLGNTGSGKSSFLNLIMNSRKELFFKIGETAESCTAEPKSLTIGSLTLWDFPGLMDTKDRDKEFIQAMLRTFQANKINAVALVHNVAEERIGQAENYLIDVICKMFPFADFWKHVVLLFTHCDTKQSKKKGRNLRGPETSEKILEIVKKHFPNIKSIVSQLPCYFVYAERDEDTNTYEDESLAEASKLIKGVASFPSINIISNKIEMSRHIIKDQKRVATEYVNEKDESISANLIRAGSHALFGAETPFLWAFGIVYKGISLLPLSDSNKKELDEAGDFLMSPTAQHTAIANCGKIQYLVNKEITYDLEVIQYSDGTSDSNELNRKERLISKVETDRFF